MKQVWAGALGAAAFMALAVHTLPAQSYRTVTASRERTNESQLDVSVEFAVGRFTLRPHTGGALYTQTLTYDEDKFAPRGGYNAARHALTAGITGLRHNTSITYPSGRTKQALEMALSPAVPTTLQLKFGAVTADIDLGGMSLVEATIETGASETSVRFDEPNQVRCRRLTMNVGAAGFTATGLGNARCDQIQFKGGVGGLTLDFTGAWELDAVTNTRVEMGLGSLTLRLPEELGVAVHLTKFLTSFDTGGFAKRGSTYYSKNYEAAKTKLAIDVNAALGEVTVEWIKR